MRAAASEKRCTQVARASTRHLLDVLAEERLEARIFVARAVGAAIL